MSRILEMAAPDSRTVALDASLDRRLVLAVPDETPELGLGITFNPPLPDLVLLNGNVSAMVAAL